MVYFPYYDPVSTADEAAWLVTALGELKNAHGVITLGATLPAGYPSYARIFHPAWFEVTQETPGCTRRPGTGVPWVVPVTWSQVAEYNDCLLAGQAQWGTICGGRSGLPVPGEQPIGQNWTHAPDEGVLTPPSVAARVFELLGQESEPETECFCARWDGYSGGLSEERRYEGGCFKTPHGLYYLYRVRFADVQHYYSTRSTTISLGDRPDIVWPDSRAWLLTSPYQRQSTYIAGSRDLVEALCASDGLEAYPVTRSDSFWEDTVNRN